MRQPNRTADFKNALQPLSEDYLSCTFLNLFSLYRCPDANRKILRVARSRRRPNRDRSTSEGVVELGGPRKVVRRSCSICAYQETSSIVSAEFLQDAEMNVGDVHDELTKGWRTQRKDDSRRRRLLLSRLRNAKNTLVFFRISRSCRGAAFELSRCHSNNLLGHWEGFRHDNGLIT